MKPISFIVILGTLLLFHGSASGAEEGGCAICRTKVAGVAVGMKAAEVKKQLGAPTSAGKYRYDGACTETFSAAWAYAEKGLEVVVTADDAAGKQAAVSEIRLTSTSPVKLEGDVGIGSSETDVKRAFGRHQTSETKERSSPGKNFMIGADCEAIDFAFKSGKVSRIRIGMTYCDC